MNRPKLLGAGIFNLQLAECSSRTKMIQKFLFISSAVMKEPVFYLVVYFKEKGLLSVTTLGIPIRTIEFWTNISLKLK